MKDTTKRRLIRAYYDSQYQVQNLLEEHFGIRVAPGDTFRCPFHDDNRNSAKIFDDNAFYCYACGLQYTPSRFFENLGYTSDQLMSKIPPGFSASGMDNRAYSKLTEKGKKVATIIRRKFKRKQFNIMDVLKAWTEVDLS